MLEIVISLVVLTLILGVLISVYDYRWQDRKDAQVIVNVVSDKSEINNIQRLERLLVELNERYAIEKDQSVRESISSQAEVLRIEIERLNTTSIPRTQKVMMKSQKQSIYDKLRSDLEIHGKKVDEHRDEYILAMSDEDSSIDLPNSQEAQTMHESIARYNIHRDAERLFVFENPMTIRFKKDLGVKFAPCSSYNKGACNEEDLCMMVNPSEPSCHTPVTDDTCSSYTYIHTCNGRPNCEWVNESCNPLPECPSSVGGRLECQVRSKGTQCIFNEGNEVAKCVMKPW